jgi:hypothetical protein
MRKGSDKSTKIEIGAAFTAPLCLEGPVASQESPCKDSPEVV